METVDLTLSSDGEGSIGEKKSVREGSEDEAEFSSCSLDSIVAIGVDEGMARRLKIYWKGTPQRKRGKPPTTGEYVGYAAAKKAAADSSMKEADAQLAEQVISKLVAAVGIFKGEGIIETTPIGELDDSIKTALESVTRISKVSKGLKGSLAGRLKAAVAIIEASSE